MVPGAHPEGVVIEGSPVIVPTREGYDTWSEIYDLEDNPLISLEEPHFRRLLGGVRGLSIADIGCGTGRHASHLIGEGAKVVGVDFSDGMLFNASEKSGAEAIGFIRGDLKMPLPFLTSRFDRVICALVLDHIHDLKALFRELNRICRPDGVLLVSVMHPAMNLLGIQARFTHPKTGIRIMPESAKNSIADYLMAAKSGGWSLNLIEEKAVDEILAEKSPRAAKYLGYPLLLLMRFTPKSSSKKTVRKKGE